MPSDPLFAFLVFAFVSSVTPGPNNIILTATGASVGVLRGLPVLLGIVCGFALMVFILALGFGGATLASNSFMDYLRYAGMALLLWLSWSIASASTTSGDDPQIHRRPVSFLAAALFQWINPKAWLVTASAISVYADPQVAPSVQALTFAATFIVAGALGCIPWLAFGAALKSRLKTPRAQRAFNLLMGAALAASILLII